MGRSSRGDSNRESKLSFTWTRDWIILILLGVFLVVIVARLTYIQVIKAGEYAEKAATAHTADIPLEARRGTIYDRNGEVLASNVDATTIYVNPQEVDHASKLAHMLEDVLGSTYGKNYQDYYALVSKKDAQFVYVQRKATPELAETLKERLSAAGLKGIHYLDDTKRIYPNEDIGSQLVGVIDTDGNGIAGLELEYDELLSGQDGSMSFEKGLVDIPVVDGVVSKTDAVDGTDIVTSIDITLQRRCEERLRSAVEEYEAKGGSVTIMDAATGEIYSSCSYAQQQTTVTVEVPQPAQNPEGAQGEEQQGEQNQQDPNNPQAQQPQQPQTTEAVVVSYELEAGKLWPATDSYEPGSTFKPFTAVSVLTNNKKITPQSTYTVPYSMEVYDSVISDSHEHGVETMTLEQILAESSNVGTTLVSREVSTDQLYDTYNAFKFGTSPGTDFPGVASGVLEKASDWDGVQAANVTFGQGVSITGLELVRGYGALEQNGVERVPHFLIDVPNNKEKADELLGPLTKEETVADAGVCSQVSAMLRSVITGGTGEAAAVDGFTVTGKTGTAEVASIYGGYEENAYIMSFCGWLYGSSSDLICLVTLDHPHSNGGGGDVCGPVFADIMSFVAERYQVDAQAD